MPGNGAKRAQSAGSGKGGGVFPESETVGLRFGISLAAGGAGQVEREGGALAGARAGDGEGAAHLLGGEGAAMQAEAVAIFLGGEAVGENAGEVFRRDANAVVAHRDAKTVGSVSDADGECFFARLNLGAGLLGIADEVDEDGDDFVAFEGDDAGRVKILDDLDVVPAQAA